MSSVRLVLALHNHQPIGNFDGVFEAAYQDSYLPLIETLREFPQLPISLHTSGSLLEWLVEHHPEYIDQVRALVERGQIEILGGPFYEPILACIPRRDRVGQIEAYSRYLERHFGTTVRGIWIPERVWEQGFVSDLAAAGIEYTLLDDFHFKNAGLSDDELAGYYLTEDEGALLKIFPGSERLRYTIPFQEPQATVDHLRQIAAQHPRAVVVFGDDGEKFGTWPGTKRHVYQDGWLRKFFGMLLANRDWIRVCTLAEVVDQVSPLGRIYLPDASYREMTEWALPVARQVEYEQLIRAHENDADWPSLRRFVRGGNWRNFRVKYPESNEMYARMLEVSRRLDELSQSVADEQHDLIERARVELYRGQCNCPYWHGAFGGLYLPHLRNAIYKHLIAADTLLEQAQGHQGAWVRIEAGDFNLDARKEIRLASERFVAFLAPSRGGHLYELDVRATGVNLLATLNRRPEVYHERIRRFAAHDLADAGAAKVASIHDQVIFKQPGLEKKLIYDTVPHKSLVDRFLQPGLTLERMQQGEGELGDFSQGVYETLLRRSPQRVEARLSRTGNVGSYEVGVVKTVTLDAEHGSVLDVLYELDRLPANLPVHFSVEFNFAAMAAGAPDRYFYDARGRQIGQLQSVLNLADTDRIGLVDEWLGLDVALEFSQPGGIWTFPIETISQSEGGYEAVHQSTAVVPHWEFVAPADGRWAVRILLSIDTSAAQARKLREAAAVG